MPSTNLVDPSLLITSSNDLATTLGIISLILSNKLIKITRLMYILCYPFGMNSRMPIKLRCCHIIKKIKQQQKNHQTQIL